MEIFGDLGTAVMRPDNDWDLRYCKYDELPAIRMENTLSANNRRYPEEKLPWIKETFSKVPDDFYAYYDKCYEFYALNRKPLVPFTETVDLMRTLDWCRSLRHISSC